MSPTATTTETAMHRSPADPYAAETAASAAISTSASGSTTMWFLAPPSACTRFACAVAGGVHVARDRRRADEADRRHGRVLEQPVHRHGVTVDHVEHAIGNAGLREQLGEEQ